MFLSDNSVKWQGDEAARTEFDTVVIRHRAIYAMSIRGFEQGPQAIQALDLNFANLPMTEVPTGPPTMYQTAGQFQSVPDITIDNVGDVFRTKMFSSDGTEQLVQILEDKNKPGEVIFDTIDS
jgi:hypothetical protein